MFQTVLLIKLLLVHYTTQSQTYYRADCNTDVSLKCSDNIGMNFISIAWYKFINKKKCGIIRRGPGINSTQRYNFTRPTEFGESFGSLFLPSVTPEDSGIYECAISANIGGQNLNHEINLTVHACMTQPNLTTRTNALNTTQEPDLPCPQNDKDLPVMWCIFGYVAVGITKIILSLISIWVIQAIRVRSSRRDLFKW